MYGGPYDATTVEPESSPEAVVRKSTGSAFDQLCSVTEGTSGEDSTTESRSTKPRTPIIANATSLRRSYGTIATPR